MTGRMAESESRVRNVMLGVSRLRPSRCSSPQHSTLRTALRPGSVWSRLASQRRQYVRDLIHRHAKWDRQPPFVFRQRDHVRKGADGIAGTDRLICQSFEHDARGSREGTRHHANRRVLNANSGNGGAKEDRTDPEGGTSNSAHNGAVGGRLGRRTRI